MSQEAGFENVRPSPAPVGSLCFVSVVQDESRELSAADSATGLAICLLPLAITNSHLSGTVNPNKSFLLQVAPVIVFWHSNRKAANLLHKVPD